MDDGVRMLEAVAIRHWAKTTGHSATVFSIAAVKMLAVGSAFSPVALADADPAAQAKLAPTTTQLSIDSSEGDSRTAATFTVHVMGLGTSATPAGSVSLKMGDVSLGSVVLDENGYATYKVEAVTQGHQQIVATFNGSSAFASSTSPVRALDSVASGLPDYTFAADKTALTIKVGQYGLLEPEPHAWAHRYSAKRYRGSALRSTCKDVAAAVRSFCRTRTFPRFTSCFAR